MPNHGAVFVDSERNFFCTSSVRPIGPKKRLAELEYDRRLSCLLQHMQKQRGKA